MAGCLVLMACIAIFGCSRTAAEDGTVVLLHGLGRSPLSMMVLQHRLQKAGYRVVLHGYASTQGAVEDHVACLAEALDEMEPAAGGKIHFVTHSLGGIVVRKYLADNRMPNLGRVVMLAPPNRGSEVADYLKDWQLYRLAMGPSGQELGTDAGSTPNRLQPVDFELGVIAGDASLNRRMSRLIPGADDGKVAVQRTKVAGMQDFRVVHHSHAFIMNAAVVAEDVISFLKTGSFRHADTTCN